MSLHKFGYSTEQLELREYQELKDMIKSQEKLAQITHSKIKEDFENELENELGNLSERLIEEKILNPQEIQNVLLNSKLINDFNSQFSDLSKTINKLEQNMKKLKYAIFQKTLDDFRQLFNTSRNDNHIDEKEYHRFVNMYEIYRTVSRAASHIASDTASQSESKKRGTTTSNSF